MNTVTLNDGNKIPAVGFGVFLIPNDGPAYDAVLSALKAGYRHIDTAAAYFNESDVGKAVRDSGIPREEIFITSKLWLQDYGYEAAKKGLETSLGKLGMDYIDLYLLHWIGRYPFSETVRALVELQQEGKIRQWGMSNLDVEDMERSLSLPHGKDCAANQVLYNLKDRGIEYDLIPWSMQHHIPVMAYMPLGEGQLRNHKILMEIARRHDATPTQVMLAWVMRTQNVIAVPKASSIAHVEENARSLDISLTEEDMRDIDKAFPAPTHKIHLAGW